jgi:hypothetical protein
LQAEAELLREEAQVHTSTPGRFFGVVARPRTWLNILFQVLAFPLGLFYFIFLVTGLSLGLGLVIIWVGIPILLVVAGAWWIFGAFERLMAEYLLGAEVGPAPRPWEAVNGVWGKLKAHFGSASTWKDLVYLLAKLLFGTISFTLLVMLGAIVGWLVAFPIAWNWRFHVISWGNGQGLTPPLWLAILALPCAILFFFLSLHIVNAWGWVCARWAELLLRTAPPAATAVTPLVPIVSTAPPAPIVSTAPPLAPTPVEPAAPVVPAAPPAPSLPENDAN